MRAPPANEAARPPRHGSAEPSASINSNSACNIVAHTGGRKRRITAPSVSRHRPSREAIRAAMRFLDPWGSR